MPISGTILGATLKIKMDSKYKQVIDYSGPLAQQDPSGFISFCEGIANGIIQGSQTIQFVTKDTGFKGNPPKTGVGVGLGINIDTAWFTKNLYIALRQSSIDTYGQTTHPAWCDEWDAVSTPSNPLPSTHCSFLNNQKNPYNFLTATCEAISESISEHFSQFLFLQSSHPMVYSGTGQIEQGGLFGLIPQTIASSMSSAAPNLQGQFWPIMCQKIAEIYSQAIMTKSTGEVIITGICIPSNSQVCGIPSVGIGNGTAS